MTNKIRTQKPRRAKKAASRPVTSGIHRAAARAGITPMVTEGEAADAGDLLKTMIAQFRELGLTNEQIAQVLAQQAADARRPRADSGDRLRESLCAIRESAFAALGVNDSDGGLTDADRLNHIIADTVLDLERLLELVELRDPDGACGLNYAIDGITRRLRLASDLYEWGSESAAAGGAS